MTVLLVSGGLDRETVMQDTWGQFAPKTGVKYFGYIIVAQGYAGDEIIFDYNFDGLNGGPWLWEDVCKFAYDRPITPSKPALWRFDGWYKRFKNGRCQFGGGHFKEVNYDTKAKG